MPPAGGHAPDVLSVQNALPTETYMAHSLTSLKYLLKCHLLSNTLLDHLIENWRPASNPAHSTCTFLLYLLHSILLLLGMLFVYHLFPLAECGLHETPKTFVYLFS